MDLTVLLEYGVKANAILLLEDNFMIRRAGNGSEYLLLVEEINWFWVLLIYLAVPTVVGGGRWWGLGCGLVGGEYVLSTLSSRYHIYVFKISLFHFC